MNDIHLDYVPRWISFGGVPLKEFEALEGILEAPCRINASYYKRHYAFSDEVTHPRSPFTNDLVSLFNDLLMNKWLLALELYDNLLETDERILNVALGKGVSKFSDVMRVDSYSRAAVVEHAASLCEGWNVDINAKMIAMSTTLFSRSFNLLTMKTYRLNKMAALTKELEASTLYDSLIVRTVNQITPFRGFLYSVKLVEHRIKLGDINKKMIIVDVGIEVSDNLLKLLDAILITRT